MFCKPKFYKNMLQAYEDGFSRRFLDQPVAIEIQIGWGLIPLVDEEKGAQLRWERENLRKLIEAKYGFLLPAFYIKDNSCLNPYEYRILLNGVDVGSFDNLNSDYVLCLNKENAPIVFPGVKTKEPVFGLDGFLIPSNKRLEAECLGYLVIDQVNIILTHLNEVIKQNITKLLNQSMVNALIKNVRDINADVVDFVFKRCRFPISKFKTILNWLLNEDICIRDMNTILETIADNLDETTKPVVLMEKIREKLAYQFLTNFADDKVIHVIRVSQRLSDILAEYIRIPRSKNELPDFELKPGESEILNKEITSKAESMKEKGFIPVFVVESNLRTALSEYVRCRHGDYFFISDKEISSMIQDYSVVVEEELDLEKIF